MRDHTVDRVRQPLKNVLALIFTPLLFASVCFARLGPWWALVEVIALCGPIAALAVAVRVGKARGRMKATKRTLAGLYAGFTVFFVGPFLALAAMFLGTVLSPGWCLTVAAAAAVAVVTALWSAQLRWYHTMGLVPTRELINEPHTVD
jgi:dolichol kinase